MNENDWPRAGFRIVEAKAESGLGVGPRGSCRLPNPLVTGVAPFKTSIEKLVHQDEYANESGESYKYRQ
jgi:hypothetical protein